MSEVRAELGPIELDDNLDAIAFTPTEVHVSAVVPMFNERARVPDLCRAIRRWSPPFGGAEVVLVDDGSTDGTADLVQELLVGTDVEYRLVRLPTNRGKGAAVREGVRNSIGTFVAFLDADLSVDFDQLERALGMMLHHRADVACGSRRHPDTRIPEPQPVLRRLGGRCFNAMVRALGLSTFLDTQCGFKVFRAGAARRIFEIVECDGFAFDVEVLYVAEHLGLEVVAVPVVWSHRDASKVSPLGDGARMARSLVGIRWRGRHLDAGTPNPANLRQSVGV